MRARDPYFHTHTPSNSSDSHCALMNLEIIGASCLATGLPSRSSFALITSFFSRVRTPRGKGALRRRRRSAVGNTWAGWGSIPLVFFLGVSGHPCLILRATSLSLQGEPANIGLGCSRPARCTRGSGDRVRRSAWDPETSRERIGDWGGPEAVLAQSCVTARRATRPNREWGYSTRRHMLEPERPEAV